MKVPHHPYFNNPLGEIMMNPFANPFKAPSEDLDEIETFIYRVAQFNTVMYTGIAVYMVAKAGAREGTRLAMEPFAKDLAGLAEHTSHNTEVCYMILDEITAARTKTNVDVAVEALKGLRTS